MTNVLFGAFGGASEEQQAIEGVQREVGVEDVAVQLAYARQVVIVPGYGLATAQAQHTVRELAEALEHRGVVVKYAIHPVAGRMPGAAGRSQRAIFIALRTRTNQSRNGCNRCINRDWCK